MDRQSGRDIRVAVSLMKMALALLDRSGENAAAARLQSAIDEVGTGETRPSNMEGEIRPLDQVPVPD